MKSQIKVRATSNSALKRTQNSGLEYFKRLLNQYYNSPSFKNGEWFIHNEGNLAICFFAYRHVQFCARRSALNIKIFQNGTQELVENLNYLKK